MSRVTVQTATIIPFAKRLRATSAGFAVAYSYKPSGELAARGTLMAAIEVLGSTTKAEATIDAIMEALSDSYYGQAPDGQEADAGSAFTRPAPNPHQDFSDAVRAVNEAIASQRPSDTKDWEERISAVVGVLVDRTLYISHTGGARAYLIRGDRHTVVTRPTPDDNDSLFTEVASGDTVPGDILLLATPALLHQLAEDELIELATDSVPTGAIAKIHELLRGQTNLERVAALVAQVATPEMLAAQLPSKQATQIEVGRPGSWIKEARGLALPAQAAVSGRAKRVLQRGASSSKGAAASSARRAGSLGRRLASNKRVAAVLGIVGAVLIISALLSAQTAGRNTQLKQVSDRYAAAYASFNAAANAADNQTAQAKLTEASSQLDALAADNSSKQLEPALKKYPVAGEHRSIEALRSAIQTESDRRSGVTRRKPSELVGPPAEAVRGQGPYQIVLLGRQLISVPTSGGAVRSYDLDKKQLLTDAALPEDIGKVVAVSAGSGGEAVYLLTAEPAVWSFKPADRSFARLKLSSGTWPAGSAIASYSGNLYIAADGRITKQVPTLAGFSNPNTAVTLSQPPGPIAIDGSIYLASGGDISRFVGGAANGTAPTLPPTLGGVDQLVADGDTLLSLSRQAGRIGIFETAAAGTTYRRQVLVDGAKLTSIAYDLRSGLVYGSTDQGALVTLSLQ